MKFDLVGKPKPKSPLDRLAEANNQETELIEAVVDLGKEAAKLAEEQKQFVGDLQDAVMLHPLALMIRALEEMVKKGETK